MYSHWRAQGNCEGDLRPDGPDREGLEGDATQAGPSSDGDRPRGPGGGGGRQVGDTRATG